MYVATAFLCPKCQYVSVYCSVLIPGYRHSRFYPLSLCCRLGMPVFHWTQRAVICVNRWIIDKVIHVNISWFDTLTPSNAVIRHCINGGSKTSQYDLALSAIIIPTSSVIARLTVETHEPRLSTVNLVTLLISFHIAIKLPKERILRSLLFVSRLLYVFLEPSSQ